MNQVGATALMSPAQQVQGETDEQRKKRQQALMASKQLPAGVSSLATDYGSALSMA